MSNHHLNVKNYYEENTRRFLQWGKNSGDHAIHQALWAEGVKTRYEAANYSAELILAELKGMPISHPMLVLDLGCGVGSTILYLGTKLKELTRITGITISPLQVKLGNELLSTNKLDTFNKIIEADFLRLPGFIQGIHLAYAIESFVHGRDPDAFFDQIASRLKKGGKLIIIDDFKGRSQASSNEQEWLNDYQNGWLVESFLTVEEAEALALKTNLKMVSNRNLTDFMEIGRWRDRMIGVMQFFLGKWMDRSVYLKSLKGGYAKQKGLKTGLIEYRILVFEKI